jgi:hypothetical protein
MPCTTGSGQARPKRLGLWFSTGGHPSTEAKRSEASSLRFLEGPETRRKLRGIACNWSVWAD